MAIVVTSLGTAQNKASADPWTAFSSVTLASGDSIVVCLAGDGTGWLVGPPAITWNGQTLAQNVRAVNLVNDTVAHSAIHSLHNVAGATGDVVIDWNPIPVAMAAALYKVSGLATSAAFDKSAYSIGTSTTPTSTQTATLAQTDELLVGCIGTEGPNGDAAGTWDTGANQTTDNGQRLGTTGGNALTNITVAAATKIVTATTGGIASKNSIDSRDWAACIATFKAAAGGA